VRLAIAFLTVRLAGLRRMKTCSTTATPSAIPNAVTDLPEGITVSYQRRDDISRLHLPARYMGLSNGRL